MDQSLTIGPFAFPAVLPLALLAFFLAGFAARRVERGLGAEVEHHLFWMLLVAGLAARLAFVLQYRESYLRAPLSALDLRDGGWNLFAAAGVAFVYAIALALRNRATRKPLAAAILTGATVWTAGALLLTATAPEPDRLPALTLRALEGGDVSLARLAGKPTVVNLWATWCPPCLREMPVLQQAQAERGDVQFVFVNQGEPAGRVRDFLATRQLRLHNVLLDEAGEMGRLTGHRALPTTLFYDARGRLVATRIGELSHATLAERLAAIGGPTEPAPAPTALP